MSKFTIKDNEINNYHNKINEIITNYYRKSGNTYNRNINIIVSATNDTNTIHTLQLLENIENAVEIEFIGISNEDYSDHSLRFNVNNSNRGNRETYIFKIKCPQIKDGKVVKDFYGNPINCIVILLKLFVMSDINESYGYKSTYYSYNILHNIHAKKFITFFSNNVSDETCEEKITKITNNLHDSLEIISIPMKIFKFGSNYKLILLKNFIDMQNNTTDTIFIDVDNSLLNSYVNFMIRKLRIIIIQNILNNINSSLYKHSDLYFHNNLNSLNFVNPSNTAIIDYFKNNIYNILIKAYILFYLIHEKVKYTDLNYSNILLIVPHNIMHMLHEVTNDNDININDVYNDIIKNNFNSIFPENEKDYFFDYIKSINNVKNNIDLNYIHPYILFIKPYEIHGINQNEMVLENFCKWDGVNNITNLKDSFLKSDLLSFLTITNIFEYEYISWLHNMESPKSESPKSESPKSESPKPNILDTTALSNTSYKHDEALIYDKLIDDFYVIYNTNCEYNPFHERVEYSVVQK
jgi:hypothetical protein